MRSIVAFIMLIFFLPIGGRAMPFAKDTFRIQSDLPVAGKKGYPQFTMYYQADSEFAGRLTVSVVRVVHDTDSVCVLYARIDSQLFKKGLGRVDLKFDASDSELVANSNFAAILKKTASIPFGKYVTTISVLPKSKSEPFFYKGLFKSDSLLKKNSRLSQDIRGATASSHSMVSRLFTFRPPAETAQTARTLQNNRARIAYSAKMKGLTATFGSDGKYTFVDYAYKDWYIGRYRVKAVDTLREKGSLDKVETTEQPYDNGVDKDLIDHPSLFSQSKHSGTEAKKCDETRGEVIVSNDFATGQEQYSAMDNNFQTVRGQIEIPVLGLPVQAEGFYTTQDLDRSAKMSYFHVHYDVNALKKKLAQRVSGYRDKYDETTSKSHGMSTIYGTAMEQAMRQRASLQNDLVAEENRARQQVPEKGTAGGPDTAVNIQGVSDTGGKKQSADSAHVAKSVDDLKNSASSFEQSADSKAAAKQQEIAALDKKIARYQQLLAQDENTNHFDSLVGYDKTKGLDGQSDVTYKKLVQKSSGILPDGEAKRFITGLSSFDAGMFSKEESKYTNSGQMVKGVSATYDFKYFEAGTMVGKMQIIGRDGTADKYTCYSERLTFKPLKGQKASLIYYGYSVDKAMVAGDAFFSHASISAPDFFRPTNIVSCKYDGKLWKSLKLEGEIGVCTGGAETPSGQNYPLGERLADRFAGVWDLAKQDAEVSAGYENMGKGFVNNTLTATPSGMEQYRISCKKGFWESHIKVGVEYDYLIQNNFTTRSSYSKAGFDIKTTFKKLPALSASYKPFITFQAYNDTFNIPRRMLFGSATSLRGSYKFKHQSQSWQINVVYSKTSTVADTSNYGSESLQTVCNYGTKVWNASVTTGYTEAYGASVPIQGKVWLFGVSADKKVGKSFSVSAGQDWGWHSFGLVKAGVSGGVSYRSTKVPYTFRVNMRFSDYRSGAGGVWQSPFGGRVEMGYRFKSTNSKNGV